MLQSLLTETVIITENLSGMSSPAITGVFLVLHASLMPHAYNASSADRYAPCPQDRLSRNWLMDPVVLYDV